MKAKRPVTRDGEPTPADNPPARYSRTSREWPCIFKTTLATERLDPAVKKLWESRRSDRPKWGDLRTMFRQSHCKLVNPWGSETCPFKEEDCALAFYAALDQSLDARNPYGYFRSVVRSMGAARADLGVEVRARMRTDVTDEGAVGRPPTSRLREGPPDRVRNEPYDRVVRGVGREDALRGVRGMAAGPEPVGDVLRTLGDRSRPRPRNDRDADEGGRR